MRRELHRITAEEQVDINFIGKAVEFMRTYGDRCHHGKEENILFAALADKSISAEHERTRRRLMQEHARARQMLAALVDATEEYVDDKEGALTTIAEYLEGLVELYPDHIATEDEHFFIPIMEYFSEAEQQDMLEEFADFDRKLFHKTHQETVTELEQTN